MNAQDFSKMTAENINLHCFLGIFIFLTIESMQGYLHRITITVAVALLIRGGGGSLQKHFFRQRRWSL